MSSTSKDTNTLNTQAMPVLISYKHRHSLLSKDIEPHILRIRTQNTGGGAHIETLSGFKQSLYSYRINKKARLIFRYVNLNGTRHVLLLQLLENHKYKKLNKNKANLNRLIGSEITLLDNSKYNSADNNEASQKRTLHTINSKSLILTNKQRSILSAKLTLMINGAPGSGKSSTAFIKLGRFVKS